YHVFGEVDEIVVAGSGDEDVNIQRVVTETIPPSAVEEVRTHAEELEIDAVGSFVVSFAPAINVGEGEADASNPMALFEQGTASEPSVGIVAAPQETFDDFHATDIDGNPIGQTQLGADKVYITEKLADNLDIDVGGKLVYVQIGRASCRERV